MHAMRKVMTWLAQRGLSLRWRIATLSSVAIALLSIIASLTAYWVVQQSLHGDLRRALREDAQRVARIYGSDYSNGHDNDSPYLPEGPTGGVVVQIYSAQGQLLASSSDIFSQAAIDPEQVSRSREELQEWQGELAQRRMRAALVPIGSGSAIVAVLSSTAFITAALQQLARALIITAVLLTVLSGVIGYLLAVAAMNPISQLAKRAAQLDPEHLTPIRIDHPDDPRDELTQLSKVLNELIERLRRTIDMQRSFLAETSHELRTPLTSLQGFLERATRNAPPAIRRDLEDATRIAQSMSRLVADLLQLTRNDLTREFEPHLLDPYNDLLKPIAEEFTGVYLRGEAGGLLLGDPERLKQLMRNLTANAVRASGDPASVILRLEQSPEQHILSVYDLGPGIPPEVLPNIFNKFYKGAGGGAGLGLAIAKQIVEAHQGHIEVESHLGYGTTFRVSLPAFHDEDDDDAPAPAAEPSRQPPAEGLAAPRVNDH